MTVVSAESRANWERLQNRRTAKLLSLQDSTRLIARDFRPKQQHWSLSWKPPALKKKNNPSSRRPEKRARESDAEEDPNKRMRVHLDLLKEYEQRQSKKSADEKRVKKTVVEVRSFFDSAEEYDDKSKVQKLSAVKAEPKDTSCPSALKQVKVEAPSTGIKVEEEDEYSLPKLRSLPLTRDSNRDRFRELLAGALSKVSGEVRDSLKAQVDKCDPFRVAAEVESALFFKWGSFSGAHKYKYRSIMFNIRDPKNPDFRRKVLLGVYPPEVSTQLTSELMASDERQSENEKIKEKALFECERGIKPKASTGAFKCGRCHKWETTYYQLQTRCADEPMTTFVTCLNCNKHWRF